MDISIEKGFCFVILTLFLILPSISSIDQGGGGSDVFKQIWQQNAKNMNQMMGTGSFTPCRIKYSGPNSQLDFGNQFGNFKPGIVVGKRSAVEQPDNCPCPAVDAQGCPTCLCINTGLGNREDRNNQTKQTTPNRYSETTKKTMAFTILSGNFKTNNHSRKNTPRHRLTTLPTPLLFQQNIQSNSDRVPETTKSSAAQRTLHVKQHDGRIESFENKKEIYASDVTKNPIGKSNEDKTIIYIGIIIGLSIFLCLVTMTTLFLLYKWRSVVSALKHEQNELYFAEKSLRLSVERQPASSRVESRAQRTVSTTSSVTTSPFSDVTLDSVFTVDQNTDVKTSPCSTIPSPTTGDTLVSQGSTVFRYPPEAYRHEYLEIL